MKETLKSSLWDHKFQFARLYDKLLYIFWQLESTQGPRSYFVFESGGADKWLKVVGLKTLFPQ